MNSSTMIVGENGKTSTEKNIIARDKASLDIFWLRDDPL
jgi:hypothetical protein